MIRHLLLRVVDPDRPDGGIVTHINGIPWAEVKCSDVIDIFGRGSRWSEAWGMSEGFDEELKRRQRHISNPLASTEVEGEKYPQDRQKRLQKMWEYLNNRYKLPQDYSTVLQKLGRLGWRVVTESVAAPLNGSDDWTALVSVNFSQQQRTSTPTSYKTITFIKD